MDLNIYKGKRVLITGHTGFKGSWLSSWLITLGADVLGYSLDPDTTPNHFDLLNLKNSMKDMRGDIRDRLNLKKTIEDFKPEIVFHLAAQPLVRESYRTPVETYETNVLGTMNLLNIARTSPYIKTMVMITTDKVYENKEWIWGYRENDALGGYDPYSSSKACADICIDSMRRSFFHIDEYGKSHSTLIATARAGNVIGGGDYSADRIIPDIIRGILEHTPTKIRSPYSTRPWQHVLEPLRAYLLLGERLLKGDVACASNFNFGPNIDGNINVESMLKLAQKSYNKISYQIEQNANNPHEANLLMLDTSKAYHLLHYSPIYDHQKSIQETFTWYKAYIEKGDIITQKQIEKYMNLVGDV